MEVSDLDVETSFISFAEEELGLHLYPWQCDVLEPFDEASEHLVQVSLATPNGSGKSAICIPALVLGWLALYPKGRVVLTTADGKQLDGQVMPAIESFRSRFPSWTFIEREVRTDTGGRFVAFTTDQAGRAEGWHKLDDNEGPLLIIADEAKTVSDEIFSAIDRCTYNALLLTSSPGRMSGRFYTTQTDATLGFVRIRVGLKDCPHITQDKIDRIIAQHGANSPFTRSALHGEFLEAFDGKPVFHAYNQDLHEGEDLPWIRGAYLARGWDFGTCNSVTWHMYWQHAGYEYLHILFEQYLEGSDTDRQAEAAAKLTEREFPFWNDRTICAGVLDFCDPSGVNANFGATWRRNGEGKAERIGSCVQILHTHGIRPGTILWQRGISIGIALINRFLLKRDHLGNPCFKIDKKNCPILSKAFRGGYAYGEPGESGYNPDNPEPRKGLAHQDFDFSHVVDSSRYCQLNTLRLLKNEYQQAKAPLFRQRETVNFNPQREI